MYIVLSIVTAIVIIFTVFVLRRRAAHIQQYMALLDLFYRSTDKLLEDPDVPVEVFETIQFISNKMYDASIVREIFFAVVNGQMTDAYANGRATRHDMLVASLRPELQGLYLHKRLPLAHWL